MKFILRNGYAGLFVPVSWGKVGNIDVNSGFTSANAAVYRLSFAWKMGQPLTDGDILNAATSHADPPGVELYTAVSQDGNTASKLYNPYRVGSWQGKDLMAWSEFLRVFVACKISHEKEGDITGGLPVAFRVGALEGKGQWEPRNLVRAWASDVEVFAAEDRAASESFMAAFDAALTVGPAMTINTAPASADDRQMSIESLTGPKGKRGGK